MKFFNLLIYKNVDKISFDIQDDYEKLQQVTFFLQKLKKKKSLAAIFHNDPECQKKSCLTCYISKLKIFKDFFHLTMARTVYIRVNGK